MNFKTVMQTAHQICMAYDKIGTCHGCPFLNENCSMFDFGEEESVSDEYLQRIENIIESWNEVKGS